MPALSNPNRRPHAIVVGADFSKASQLAILQAWHLATQREYAVLHLVYVIEDRGMLLNRAQRLHRRERMSSQVD